MRGMAMITRVRPLPALCPRRGAAHWVHTADAFSQRGYGAAGGLGSPGTGTTSSKPHIHVGLLTDRVCMRVEIACCENSHTVARKPAGRCPFS